jgi:hypothetical protein
MGESKGLGSKLVGLFVERDAATNASDAETLIAKYGADAAPPPVELAGPLPQPKGGVVDFAQVYELAKVGAEERGRVDKARELLHALPADTAQAVKRQIVDASLRAFGIPTEKILAAARAEAGALDAFVRQGGQDLEAVVRDGNARIASLEQQVAEVRQVMQQAAADQQKRTELTAVEKTAVQQVLDFFASDAPTKPA